MRILLVCFYDPNHLGLRYLASAALRAGHEVCICQLKDFRHRPLSPDDTSRHTGYFLFTGRNFSSSGDTDFPITSTELALFEEAIKSWRPDIIGFTLRSPYNHLLPSLIPVMRRAAPHAFIVGGGFGPTYEPKSCLCYGADAVIRGEGEGALLDLAAALAGGTAWKNIQNISFLQKNILIDNPLRPLLTDLDACEFALYYGEYFISIEDDVVVSADMRLRSLGGSYARDYTILAGRGCIGNCSYCAGGNWREQYRRQGLSAPRLRCRSLENVFEELLVARAHGEKKIIFSDEYFVRPTRELIAFFTKYAEKIALPFYAHLHHQQLYESPELLQTVKYAGLTGVAMGVQSGSEEFARRVYNRTNSNEKILACMQQCQKNGLSGNYQIIGGNPLENDEDIDRLYEFCAAVPFDPSMKTDWHVHSAKLSLLAGSPLYETHPDLKNSNYSTRRYAVTILLAELCNKVDEKTFANIREDAFFNEYPERLHALLRSIIRDRHNAYLLKEIDRLHGKEVYFWGCGEMYRYKRHFFESLRPRCILVDVGTPPEKFDNLPIYNPKDILPHGDVLPIIVFSSAANKIFRSIESEYPQYTDIVTCAVL